MKVSKAWLRLLHAFLRQSAHFGWNLEIALLPLAMKPPPSSPAPALTYYLAAPLAASLMRNPHIKVIAVACDASAAASWTRRGSRPIKVSLAVIRACDTAMNGTEFQFACLNDPRLAAHALSPVPVWLWSADASRILWANPVAAEIFEADVAGRGSPRSASMPSMLRPRRSRGSPARCRRAARRGSNACAASARAVGGTLTCLCSRIALADNTAGRAGRLDRTRRQASCRLPERARRLFADFARPAAVFTADGELIEARPEARERFGKAADLTGARRRGKTGARGHAQRPRRRRHRSRARHAVPKLGAGSRGRAAARLSRPRCASRRRNAAPARAPRRHAPARRSSRNAGGAKSRRAPSPSRRFPLRFVWQMDAATRFTLGADGFRPAARAEDRRRARPALGRDRGRAQARSARRQVAAALAARDTWSGIVVFGRWTAATERLPIEMSGLPVFDRDRQFTGFRGFGICRDVDRLAAHRARAAPKWPALAAKSRPRCCRSARRPRRPRSAGAEPRRTITPFRSSPRT